MACHLLLHLGLRSRLDDFRNLQGSLRGRTGIVIAYLQAGGLRSRCSDGWVPSVFLGILVSNYLYSPVRAEILVFQRFDFDWQDGRDQLDPMFVDELDQWDPWSLDVGLLPGAVV
jgi:hypothetical protein